MTDVVVVLTTVPNAEAGGSIAEALIGERLAACVQVSAAVTSVYRWDGALVRDTEHQLTIKTTRSRLPALEARLGQLHPYEVPELLVCPVFDGSERYLGWVRAESRSDPT